MSINVTITFNDELEVANFFAQRLGTTGRVQLVQSLGGTFADAATAAAAPGKSKAEKTASAAPTAPSAPTAEAVVAAAPAPSTSKPEPQPSTETAAAASSADQPVPYADLFKAVGKLHAKDKTAALPIAKSFGFENFLALKDEANAHKRAEVLAAVNAKIAELGA